MAFVFTTPNIAATAKRMIKMEKDWKQENRFTVIVIMYSVDNNKTAI